MMVPFLKVMLEFASKAPMVTSPLVVIVGVLLPPAFPMRMPVCHAALEPLTISEPLLPALNEMAAPLSIHKPEVNAVDCPMEVPLIRLAPEDTKLLLPEK